MLRRGCITIASAITS